MNCEDVKFGSGDCAYNIMLPYLVDGKPKTVTVDKCLLFEVVSLWESGIKTTGCCCGHGETMLAVISVKPEYNDKMRELGYKKHKLVENAYIPKTGIEYGYIDKGFNWWDKPVSEQTLREAGVEVDDG
jgi:hypothetical protein